MSHRDFTLLAPGFNPAVGFEPHKVPSGRHINATAGVISASQESFPQLYKSHTLSRFSADGISHRRAINFDSERTHAPVCSIKVVMCRPDGTLGLLVSPRAGLKPDANNVASRWDSQLNPGRGDIPRTGQKPCDPEPTTPVTTTALKVSAATLHPCTPANLHPSHRAEAL